MSFQFKKLELPGLVLIEPQIFGDPRGIFLETYKEPDFKEAGINKTFPQTDHSRSKKNVLRGMHYQKPPMAQAKLVDVVNGEIFDVVVDMRKSSPAYGKWFGVTLGGPKRRMLYIPEGFAHGFYTLSETADIIYHCSEVYAPELQRGILWDDPELNISWPAKKPILSDKDQKLPLFSRADNNFV